MRKYLIIFLLGMFCLKVIASPVGECEGTPMEAVKDLPSPLDEWGVIVCTPYGHIISNKEGWIWSNPGSYSPVMIPSQMVRSNPEALGNKSHFTEISLNELKGKAAASAIDVFRTGFDKSSQEPRVYSVKVVSVSGKELGFQFFEFEDHHWGMWCNEKCNPDSRFMILNMDKKPNK